MSSDPTYYRLSRAVHFGKDVFLRFADDHGVERQLYLTAEDFGAMLALLNRLTKAAPIDFLAMQAATPAEDNETFHVPSAIDALTKRVRALEARAEPAASAPLDFGHEGTMYVSPAVINKVRGAEKSVAAASVVNSDRVDIAEGPDWTATHDFASGETRFESRPADKPVPSASKLYDEITRITTEPAANLLARIEALENAVCTLDVRLSDAEVNVGDVTVALYGNEPSRDDTREPRP